MALPVSNGNTLRERNQSIEVLGRYAMTCVLCAVCLGIIGCRPVTGALCMSVSGPVSGVLRITLPAVPASATLTDTTALGKLRLGC